MFVHGKVSYKLQHFLCLTAAAPKKASTTTSSSGSSSSSESSDDESKQKKTVLPDMQKKTILPDMPVAGSAAPRKIIFLTLQKHLLIKLIYEQ